MLAISYMNNLVNDKHLKWIEDRFKQIKHDGLTMADKSLEEWLFKQKLPSNAICPLFRAT